MMPSRPSNAYLKLLVTNSVTMIPSGTATSDETVTGCELRLSRIVAGLLAMESDQTAGQLGEVTVEVHPVDAARGMQLVMDQPQRFDPVPDGVQLALDQRMLGPVRLQPDEAGDDLQVVLHPVLQLVQQPLLLLGPSAKLAS